MTGPPAQRSVSQTWLGWRTDFRFGALERALLALYIGVLLFTIRYHEPWVDEAQAWLIARDNSVWQILRYRLHYEGHPGLWHVLLHLFQHLGGHYAAIDYFGAVFAIGGIAVFLRYSPFPLLLRILIPFSFFLQYQYAVIARSYTLFPLLAFALCALFYSKASPLWFAILAGLLANVSFQGAVYSFLLVAIYGRSRTRSQARPEGLVRNPLKALAPSACLYLALFAVAAFTAAPAPDTGIANGEPVTEGGVAKALAVFPGTLPKSEFLPALPMPQHQAPAFVLLQTAPYNAPAPSAMRHPALWAGDYVNRDHFDAHGVLLARTPAQNVLKALIELLTLATAPLATLKLPALIFLVTLIVWLRRRRKLIMLLPWGANIIVGEILWIADHHLGLLLIALLSAIWLSAPRPGEAGTAERSTPTLMLVLTFIVLLQIGWTWVAVRNDLRKPYDPGPETAAWLLAHPHHSMAAFGFVATDVQPFYNKNPFFNLRRSYYIWAVGHNSDLYHFAVLEQHPDVVLLSQDLLAPGFTHNDWAPLSRDGIATQDVDLAWNPIVQDLHYHGYTETHRFCGDRFFRLSSSYRACNLIFEPTQETASSR